MSKSLFANPRVAMVSAAIIAVLAVTITFAVSTVLPQNSEVEQQEAETAHEGPEAAPLVVWSADDEMADGWGASAITAAQSGGGFAPDRPRSSDPFGNYRPETDQERGSMPTADPNGQARRRITGPEAAMLEPRGKGMAAIPIEPQVVR